MAGAGGAWVGGRGELCGLGVLQSWSVCVDCSGSRKKCLPWSGRGAWFGRSHCRRAEPRRHRRRERRRWFGRSHCTWRSHDGGRRSARRSAGGAMAKLLFFLEKKNYVCVCVCVCVAGEGCFGKVESVFMWCVEAASHLPYERRHLVKGDCIGRSARLLVTPDQGRDQSDDQPAA